jgi:hypothetical protein
LDRDPLEPSHHQVASLDCLDSNRGRWPLRDSWLALQHAFDDYQADAGLPDAKLALVRDQRHTGDARGMHRMAAGQLTALDCLDIDPGATWYAWLQYMQRIAHLAAKAQSQRWDACAEVEQQVQRILRGMGVRKEKAAEAAQLLDMAVGVFSAAGVLALQVPDERDTMADLLVEIIDQ